MKHKNNQIWRRFLEVEVLGEWECWVMIWAEQTEQGALFSWLTDSPKQGCSLGGLEGVVEGLVTSPDPSSLEKEKEKKKHRGGEMFFVENEDVMVDLRVR